MKQRNLLSPFTLLCAVLYALAFGHINAQGQSLLDPRTQPKFVNPLPIPSVAQPTTSGGTNYYEVSITQFRQDLGLINVADSTHFRTTVWGYGGRYPGPTIEARKEVPIMVRWSNELTDSSGNPLPHLFHIDTTMLWANPPGWPGSGVPTVTHVHGAHAESASDGLPEAWYTPSFAQTGMQFVKQTYFYDNTQDAATLWYHDHALGITRLNLHAGLAGFYLLRSDEEEALNLPKGDYEIPLLIQDRMFTSDGELYYPESSLMFFGDFILVNGMTWPKLDVEPRKYRFRILNGSDSRFYNLWLEHQGAPGLGVSFNQIGTDGGLLNTPVTLDSLLIAPAERRDVVVDFSNFRGKTIILRNDAKALFPVGDNADRQTTGLVMMFQVDSISVTDSSSLPTNLRPSNPIVKIDTTSADTSRVLIIGDVMIGSLSEGWKKMNDPVTEIPKLNTTEIWEVMNFGGLAHPTHLHLVQFQLIDHQSCTNTGGIPGKPSDLVVSGPKFLPKPDESGWKDTQIMYPYELTRVIARFDREGLYMWHCHILSHEDMDMMRPFEVQAVTSVDDDTIRASLPQSFTLAQNFPNPFNPVTKIAFTLSATVEVEIQVFNILGERVCELLSRRMPAGNHIVTWDGRDGAGATVGSGIYVYRIQAGDFIESKKMVLLR